MISIVVVAVALVASTCALPITPEEQITTGIEGISQTLTGTQLTQTNEKTGLQGSPETYTPTGQVYQPEKSSSTSQQYTEPNTAQQFTQVEKTGVQTPEFQTGHQTLEQTGSNTPVTKIENVPVNVEHVQPILSETPVLLPVQPLAGGNVLPVSPVGQVPRPVIVPAEAIATGRVIIMSMEPIEQRTFQQEVVVNPENYVPYQQVSPAVVSPVQGQVVEPNQQTYFVQPVETQPNQETVVREQTPVRQTAESVPQAQSAPTETTVRQGSEYVPVNTQSIDPSSLQQQQSPQKQSQTHDFKPIVVESVQKLGLQQTTGVETPNIQSPSLQQFTTQQGIEKKVPYEPTSCNNPTENQQQVYNALPNQNQVSHEKTGETNFTPTNTVESQQEGQNYRGSEKQFPQRTPVETQQVTQQQQQQVYSLQPQVPEQTVDQVPYQQQQELKTSEVGQQQQQQQQISPGQPQQVVNYQFGDKIPQVEHKNPVNQ